MHALAGSRPEAYGCSNMRNTQSSGWTSQARFVGIAAASIACITGTARVAHADQGVRFGANDVRSVAVVTKSENKNEVHYAIALDDQCMPVGRSPVYGYWQMRERGPDVVEPILDREQRAYGIASQSVSGNTVSVHLRALPDRAITFETTKKGNVCTARALAPIDGKQARLANVYVKLGFLSVQYLLVQGIGLDDGKTVRERVAAP